MGGRRVGEAWAMWVATRVRCFDPVTPAPVPASAMRDPQAALHSLLQQWPNTTERWVFGYASLIWRPEFDAAEDRPALVHGWHRALRMRSRVNRGTPEVPGLVFALLAGGACRGRVYRLNPATAEAEIERLWAREMPNGVYDARVLPCRTPQGPVSALAFTLGRRSEARVGPMSDEELLHVLRHAEGRYGSTLDYLAQTAHALRQQGVRDRAVERLMTLARRHDLLSAGESSHGETAVGRYEGKQSR